MGSCAIGIGRDGGWKLEDGRPKALPGLNVSLKPTRSELHNFKRDT